MLLIADNGQHGACLRITDQPYLDSKIMIFKYCHGGIHLAETKLFVELLFAWIGVKYNFFMTLGELDQFLDYGLSQT